MRHEHLSVTVDAGTKDRIDDDLERGESLEAWVADAIERKLDDEDSKADGADVKSGDGDAKSDEGRKSDERARRRDSDDAGGGYAGGEHDEDSYDEDDYDEGFEYVDDCAI